MEARPNVPDSSFSVIIPARGDGPWLRLALRSALAQPETGELLIVHDRRPGADRLPAELTVGGKVRLLESHAPGPAAARNAGIAAARFPRIAFLDDDDYWLSGHLAGLDAALERWPAAVMAATDAFLWTALSPEASPPADPGALPRFLGSRPERLVSRGDLLVANPILTPAVALDLARLGARPAFDETLLVMEDHDLWLRLAESGAVLLAPDPTVVVRRRSGSASGEWRRMAEFALLVLERALARTPQDQRPAKAPLRRRRARLYHDLAYACLIEDAPAAARRALTRAIPGAPFRVKNYAYLFLSLLPSRFRRAILRGRVPVDAIPS